MPLTACAAGDTAVDVAGPDPLAEEIHALATTRACPPVERVDALSSPRDEGRLVFTPDGDTAYFHVANADGTLSILESHRAGDGWTPPVQASFSGGNDFDAFVTPDGSQLWFSSFRGVDGGPPRPDTDLWYVTRRGDGWSEPRHVGAPISSPYWENYPSLTADGTLYFNTNRAAPTPTTFDGWDIYAARPTRRGFAPAEPLDAGINTDDWEFNPAPIAGGRVLVFASTRPGGQGGPDLYASVKVGRRWLPAINLGPCVNTGAGEYHPSFSAARGALAFVRFAPETAGDFYEVDLGWLVE